MSLSQIFSKSVHAACSQSRPSRRAREDAMRGVRLCEARELDGNNYDPLRCKTHRRGNIRAV